MKIIFSSYDSLKNPFYSGGGAFAIHEVAKRLAVADSVTVVAGAFPGAQNQKIDSVHYTFIGSRIRNPLISQLVYYFSLWWYVLTQSFDVWFESFTPPVSTSFLQLLTQKPVVGVAHNLCASNMRKKYSLPFDVVERMGLRTYKTIMALTQTQKQKIIDSGSHANIVMCPNASSIEDTAPVMNSKYKKHRYFLFIGRIDVEQKGLDLLLEAFSKVAATVDEDLYIAGVGSSTEEEKFSRILHEYGLTDRVKMLGKVEGGEKKDLYQHTTALLFPSRFEGQGITFLEAIQHDKVVLCFNVDDVNWLADSLCIKVGNFDTDAYAKKIVQLSKELEYRRKIELKIKKEKKKYLRTWDQVTDEYKKIIAEIKK